MSWSECFTAVAADQIGALQPANEHTRSSADQFEVALATGAAIAESGVVGDPGKHRFNVVVSGHSNPGHEPSASYANDCVSVSVSQAI